MFELSTVRKQWRAWWRQLARPSQAPHRQRARPQLEHLETRLAPSATPTTVFAVTEDWGSSFQAALTLKNPANGAAVLNWKLEFDFAPQISSVWDAKIDSHSGSHYVLESAGWNSTLAVGSSVSFGFVAGPGNTKAVPTNYLLNGTPLGGTLPPVSPPPVSPPPVSPPPVSPPPVSPPPVSAVQFQDTNDWGSGYNGQITITNPGRQAVTNWTLEFDTPAQISSIWNASISSHTGSHYVIQNAGWNSTIAVGAAVSFGFTASPGNVGTGGPTNYVLHGGGAVSTGPVANNGTTTTTVNQPVTVAVLANAIDTDGSTLSLSAVGAASHGTVVRNAAGTATYTPAAGFVGNDTFTYTVSDGHGGTATGTIAVTVTNTVPVPPVPPVTPSSWPAQVYAPYVDATAWPTYDFVAVAKSQGVKFFNLAFIVADPGNQPAWGGYQAYDVQGSDFSATMKSQITALRQLGGDVRVSFGGAANQELALVDTDVATLQRAYQSVIDTYQLTHIDFDIEGAAVADRASIDRRSQALAGLEKAAAAAGRELSITFTLPVLPTGLTSDGVYVLQSALKYGVVIGGVNIMAMDYGDSAAPNPNGQMGTYAIQAANSLFTQLKGVYGTTMTDTQLWHLVGITPLIGVNDVATEVFDQQAARQVLSFAQQHGLGELSLWSLNRDQQDPHGVLPYSNDTSSSILQQPYEFSHIFEPFTG